MKAASAQDQEMFKTFIVRFIGDQSFSFYNVDKPQEGTDQEALDSYFLNQQRLRNVDLNSGEAMDRTAAPTGSDFVSASPQSSSEIGGSASGDPFGDGSTGRSAQTGQNPQPQRAQRDLQTQQSHGDGDFTFVVSKEGEFDSRLTQQACSLQQSINDQNVTGSEFNRQEAEAKIELDFLSNDLILKL